MVPVAMAGSARERCKDLLAGFESQLLALTNLQHRGVVHHAQGVVRDLDREMKIAKEPAQPRGARRRLAQRELEHRLRLLLDHINGRGGLMEHVAMLQRKFKIEA